MIFHERAVTALRQNLPTIIDCILKIGGFIAFVKLFSFVMAIFHENLFIKKLNIYYFPKRKNRGKEIVASPDVIIHNLDETLVND